jgi:YbgC/YbaW family acyl-CoA thioester hydrolase
MPSFTATRRVEFRDTDAAGIMHFASFFPLMESVEHEFLRHLGLSVLANDGTGPVSWPRVNAQCDFRSAVRFEDELEIELQIVRLGKKASPTSSIFVGENPSPRENRLPAAGSTTGGPMTPIPIPPATREVSGRFGAAVPPTDGSLRVGGLAHLGGRVPPDAKAHCRIAKSVRRTISAH